MITDPRLKSPITASAPRITYRELVRWMAADYGFDEIDACTLPSQAGRIWLENVGDPKYAMGMRQF